ncbi:type II toxin-antitoxin system Phd/YefM family antitoxin [Levilactobacillus suantsaii]|uniref:Type II toxin-antitoxin system Phd/YefM family antitoxin n=2 Tax=Levilactobacillus suantsaii TaxID=2292255 RepID=A0A4Q0VL17_9LACO|nr:type II toxin-antitoxin system Phd/YefM family antitoxin [Levilactobacillus suantsaii]
MRTLRELFGRRTRMIRTNEFARCPAKEVFMMEHVTDSELQRKLCHYLNGVTDRQKPVMVTTGAGEEVVLISEADYQNLRANQRILGDPQHQVWIQALLRQVQDKAVHTS